MFFNICIIIYQCWLLGSAERALRPMCINACGIQKYSNWLNVAARSIESQHTNDSRRKHLIKL